ncbi:MAG: WYL domain-containing protein [Pseudomonadota bacterium]|nr:WYL domain-containing protein [Pseudomonadota bacterium]
MTRKSKRLLALHRLLAGGQTLRAEDLAQATGASLRTIYRDMDLLQRSGLPVQGQPGTGYHLTPEIALPPLSLSEEELGALNLGIAIVAETDDPELRAAAQSLADKIDAAMPEQADQPGEAWATAHAAPRATRGFAHIPALRRAIRARQKLLITVQGGSARRVRPLRLEHWARLWVLTAWCEDTEAFAQFRTDNLTRAEPLPELFVDEPGKRLADFNVAP